MIQISHFSIGVPFKPNIKRFKALCVICAIIKRHVRSAGLVAHTYHILHIILQTHPLKYNCKDIADQLYPL